MRDHTDPASPLHDPANGRPDGSARTVDTVLGDAVTVLRAFGTDDTHLTTNELVGRTGLPLRVAVELVQALVTSRLLEPTGTGYRLPLHCTAIGKVMLANAEDATFDAVVTRGLTPAGPKTITVPAVLHAQLQTIAESGLAFAIRGINRWDCVYRRADQSGGREGDRRGQHRRPD